MKELKEQIIEALQDAIDLETGEVSVSYFDELLDYVLTEALHIYDVNGSLLKSLHQDLKGFQEMGFLTPDAKSGLGIAIEQVESYMRGDLEARQQ